MLASMVLLNGRQRTFCLSLSFLWCCSYPLLVLDLLDYTDLWPSMQVLSPTAYSRCYWWVQLAQKSIWYQFSRFHSSLSSSVTPGRLCLWLLLSTQQSLIAEFYFHVCLSLHDSTHRDSWTKFTHLPRYYYHSWLLQSPEPQFKTYWEPWSASKPCFSYLTQH